MIGDIFDHHDRVMIPKIPQMDLDTLNASNIYISLMKRSFDYSKS